MKRTLCVCAALVVATAVALVAQAPRLEVNPYWPQPLPNHWVFGSITGVAVDAQDHVWVTHRGADSLEGNEKGMMATPQTSTKCCVAAPFILEFDADGKLLSHFAGRLQPLVALTGTAEVQAALALRRRRSGLPVAAVARRHRGRRERQGVA